MPPQRTQLTSEQKINGRVFLACAQAALTKLNREQPPDHRPPAFTKVYRHPCPGRGDVSTALGQHEVYVRSDTVFEVPLEADLPDVLPHVKEEALIEGWTGDDGTFAFIYKEGICAYCKQIARSPAGFVVVAADRPPLAGRMARSG